MKRKVIVLALLVAISTSFSSGCAPHTGGEYQILNPAPGITQFENGTLLVKYGVPFLSVSGNPYEMGLQYGVLLKDRLVSVYSDLDHLEKSVFRNLPLYLRPLISIFIFAKLIWIKHSLPDEFKEELRGISDGSGVSYNKLLLVSVLPEIFNFSCTSFIKIENGKLFHGRNLDYYFPMIGKNPLVIRYNPKGKIPYTLIGCVGYTGGYTGINDRGITVSVDAAPIVNPDRSAAVPVTFQVRRILESAKNMQDVRKLFQNYRAVKGWMVIVGSAKEKTGSIFNIAGSRISETHAGPNGIFVTNTFADKNFAHKYMALSDAESESSVCRYKMFSSLFKSINSVQSAINALSNYDFFEYGSVIGAGDVTVNNEGTLQTVVMDPSDNAVYFSSSSEGMYAGLDKSIKFSPADFENVSIYKEASPKIREKSFVSFAKWFSKAEVYYLEGNYKKAFALVKDIKHPNLMQLEGESAVAEKLGILEKDGALIEKADYLIKKYPDYSMPYLVKAKVLFAKKKYKEVIRICSDALKTKICPLYEKAEILSLLAESYAGTGDKQNAKHYARSCVSILNGYAKGKKELEIYAKMKLILTK